MGAVVEFSVGSPGRIGAEMGGEDGGAVVGFAVKRGSWRRWAQSRIEFAAYLAQQ